MPQIKYENVTGRSCVIQLQFRTASDGLIANEGQQVLLYSGTPGARKTQEVSLMETEFAQFGTSILARFVGLAHVANQQKRLPANRHFTIVARASVSSTTGIVNCNVREIYIGKRLQEDKTKPVVRLLRRCIKPVAGAIAEMPEGIFDGE